MSLKKISVDQAVDMVIPHDLTEIVKGEKKGPAFKKGHIIRKEDIPILKDIGKYNIYVLELSENELHEDDAARLMSKAIAGRNIEYDRNPVEGKVGYRALVNGLLRINADALYSLNLLGEVMLATLHDNIPVKKGMDVAAGRAIPLVTPKKIIDEAVSIANDAGGIVSVLPWKLKKASIVVTGREVFEGRIKDAFGPVMKEKLKDIGMDVISTKFASDDQSMIAQEIKNALAEGAELILCTGGMSVDPDDVTRSGIAEAGARDVVYGSPVLPGAMFLVAYIDKVPVLGIPACGMFFRTTVLDLILPRVLAGEKINREKIAALGHGGLCLGCKPCRFPACSFGKY
jgi:molybdenum cofactor synthesis domain-containing protein